MAQVKLPEYAGVLLADTNNTANAVVTRGSDKSISVGQANVTQLATSGGLTGSTANFTSVGTLTAANFLVSVDGTSGAFALNLPVASASAGVMFFVVLKNAAHTVTITTNGADNIVASGAGTGTTFALSTIGQHVVLWCDGTQWYVK